MFGLIVYKLFLYNIILKENVNIFSYVFLYLMYLNGILNYWCYNDFYLLCLNLFYAGTDILTIAPDEDNLVKLLVNISNQWYVIGKALRVSINDLNGLLNGPQDNKVKLIQVINTWFTSQPSPITWGTVISAIEGNIVRNLAKANEIRDHLGLPRCQ